MSAVAAVMLLLAGCGGDEGAAGDPSVPDSELVGTSPLAERLNLENAGSFADRQQQAVAKCMKRRGWDYTPVEIPGGVEEEITSLDEYRSLFDETYRTTWGYGISTIYDDDGTYAEGAPVQLGDSATQDPNQSYVEGLSSDEQAKYYEDLFGSGAAGVLGSLGDGSGDVGTIPGDAGTIPGDASAPSTDPNSGSDSDLGTGSTPTRATDDVAGAGSMLDQLAGSCAVAGLGLEDSSGATRLNQLMGQLGTALEEAHLTSTTDLVDSSDELANAQREWSACMAESDYDVETVDDPRKQLGDRLDEVLFAAAPDPSEPEDPAASTTTAPDAGTSTSGGSDVVASGSGDEASTATGTSGRAFDPATVDIAELNRLQSDELTMAETDRNCQAATFRPVYLQVRDEAETTFVNRNGDLLDELSQLTGLG